MALSIDEIMRRMGINENSGSFSQEEEDVIQTRQLEDTRRLTAGGKGAAGPDPRIAAFRQANRERAEVAGLTKPKLSKDLLDRIRMDESKPGDITSGDFTFYEEEVKGKTLRNIGPGLNLEDPLTEKLITKHGGPELMNFILANKGISGLKELRVPMEKVFRDRVSIAADDAEAYVGKSGWKSLDQNHKDALINMSYNLGRGKIIWIYRNQETHR